jgi:hypothetical protein
MIARSPRFLLTLIVIASSMLVTAIGPSVASGATARIADTAAESPEYGPTLGDGYVYWVTSKHEAGDGPLETQTLHQQRLSDGRTRVVFRKHRAIFSALAARGDKVAFALTWTERRLSSGKSAILSDHVFAMSGEDAAPTAVLTSRVKISRAFSVCGFTNELYDVTPQGQALVEVVEIPCGKGKFKRTSSLYSLSGAAPVTVPSLQQNLFATLQYGHLAIVRNSSVSVHDLATGVNTVHQYEIAPQWLMFSPAGDLATVTERKYDGRTNKSLYETKIFPSGSQTPTARIQEWLDADPILAFCASGLIQLNISGGRLHLRMRAKDGTLIKTIEGPAIKGSADVAFDESCSGDHLTLALSRGNGEPKITTYDF